MPGFFPSHALQKPDAILKGAVCLTRRCAQRRIMICGFGYCGDRKSCIWRSLWQNSPRPSHGCLSSMQKPRLHFLYKNNGYVLHTPPLFFPSLHHPKTVLEDITNAPICGSSVEYKSSSALAYEIERLSRNPREIRQKGRMGHLS